jgi:hypothetical protein
MQKALKLKRRWLVGWVKGDRKPNTTSRNCKKQQPSSQTLRSLQEILNVTAAPYKHPYAGGDYSTNSFV